MSQSIDDRLDVKPTAFRFGQPAGISTAGMAMVAAPSRAFRLLIVFLLLMYSSIAQIFPQLDTVRPAMTIAILAIVMMIAELSGSSRSFRFMWPQSYMLVALLGVAIMSMFNAIYLRTAANTTMDFAKVVLIYILIENTVTSDNRLRTLLLTLVVGGMFPALGSISNYMSGKLVEGSRAAWVGIFANPNELAYALVVLVPIAAALIIGAPRWQQLALVGIIATYFLAIYLTFSRGGLLGLFAVVALFGWRQKSIVIRGMMVAVLIAGLAVVSMFWNRKDNFENIGSNATVNQRIATIKAGLLMFAGNPFLGVGPGCSLVAYPLYVPKEAHCGCQDQLVVHNSFIQILGELGALGFIPWMVFLSMSVIFTWRLQKNALDRKYAAALELGLFGYIVCSLSGGFTYSWFPYIFGAMVVALKRISEGRSADAVTVA